MTLLNEKLLENPRAFPMEAALRPPIAYPMEAAQYQFLVDLLLRIDKGKYSSLYKSYVDYLISCSEAELEFLRSVKDLLEPKSRIRARK